MTVSPLPEADVDALIADGQAAQREARRDDARALYEAALYRLNLATDGPRAAALMRWVARCHMDSGNLDASLDAAEAALAVATACGDGPGEAHGMNMMATVMRERGDMPAAEGLYLQALERATAVGDLLLVSMVEQNLGVVANIRGDLNSALRHYHAALAAHRANGEPVYATHTLNNLGMLYTDLRRWRAAERAYRQALELSAQLGDTGTQALIEGNRAELWIAQGRWGRARRACRAARRLARSVGDTAALSETHKHLGVIARETGDWAKAEDHLARAARMAAKRGDLILGAEAAREQADLFRRQHRYRDTLRALNQSHSLFKRLEARRDVADVAERLGDLEGMFLNIVTLWGQSIETADSYTQGHCVRVAEFACTLASAAGLTEQELLWFRMGALLHDVGKIVVPPEVLNKPGRLTPEERLVMERHPVAGEELLADIEFPWDIRPMVRHHHERWDGSGYPDRLGGDTIPISARILCVADVYDALATDRPYRKANTHAETLSIMNSESGSTFDPELFDLFREVLGEKYEAAGTAA